jgi:urease beta subunit
MKGHAGCMGANIVRMDTPFQVGAHFHQIRTFGHERFKRQGFRRYRRTGILCPEARLA